MCMSVLTAWMPVYHVHAYSLWRSEEGLDPLELELQLFESRCVGARNQT